jgi:hypothetical protein
MVVRDGLGLRYMDSQGLTESLTFAWFTREAQRRREKSVHTQGPLNGLLSLTYTREGLKRLVKFDC